MKTTIIKRSAWKIRRLTLLSYSFAALIFLNFELIDGVNLFVSHLFLALFAMVVVTSRLRFSSTIVYVLLVALLFTASYLSATYFGRGDRYFNDTTKLVLYLGAVYALVKTYVSKELLEILKVSMAAYALHILILYINEVNAFSYSGRMFLDDLGGPNPFSSVLGIFIIVILSEKKRNFLNTGLLCFFTIYLILSFSRAVILSLLVTLIISIAHSWSVRRILQVFCVGIIIFLIGNELFPIKDVLLSVDDKIRVIQDLKDKGGSGRLDIWSITIQQLLDNPFSLVFGYGPGKRAWQSTYINYKNTIWHPHNTYLYALHSYGITGLIILLTGIYSAIKKARVDRECYNLRILLICYYISIFIFDVHIISSQVIIVHTFVLAYLFSLPENKGKYFAE